MDLNNLYKNRTDSCSTPKEIYELFKSKGYFDPCPLDDNGWDALFIEWPNKCFVNPPYSSIEGFVSKSILLFETGKVKDFWLLLPSRTSSKWFQWLWKCNSLFVFVRGRLRFGDSKHNAPFDSVLVRVGGFDFMENADLVVVDKKDLVSWLEEWI